MVMETPPPLAKLTVPALAAVLPRPRLFQLLDQAREAKLVWIVGPPGSGKTTLLASYRCERRLGGIWYRLDEGDADPATLFHYLSQAAYRLAPAGVTLPAFTPEMQHDPLFFGRRFFRELYRRIGSPPIVMFDDGHALRADAWTHRLIVIATEELPPGGSLLITSRAEPTTDYARLRANGLMAKLGWEDLQLTMKETEAITRLHRPLSDGDVRVVWERTNGWVAGVVLSFERLPEATLSALSDPLASRTVREYFSSEILGRLGAGAKRALMETVFLPDPTPSQLRQLTGGSEAEETLGLLHKNNYFVTKQPGHDGGFRLHPLFQECLKSEAAKVLGEDRSVELRVKAAELLSASGRPDDAADLLKEAAAWDRLAMLVCRAAPEWLTQGRYHALRAWILAIPKETRRTAPWLQYWLGVSRLPFDPVQARHDMEDAYQGFQRTHDRGGALLACAAALDAIYLSLGSFLPADRWAERVERLLSRQAKSLGQDVEVSVLSALFRTMLWRRPDHPRLTEWAGRLELLVEKDIDLIPRATAIASLQFWYSWCGYHAKAESLTMHLRHVVQTTGAAPLTQIIAHFMEACHAWNVYQPNRCCEAVRAGCALAEQTGVHVMDNSLLSQAVYNALILEDTREAATVLTRLERIYDDRRPLEAGHHHFLLAYLAWVQKDLLSARQHARVSYSKAVSVGTPFPQAICLFLSAWIELEAGHLPKAVVGATRALKIARSMRSLLLEFMGQVLRARIALTGGRRTEAGKHLASAFRVGREQGYLTAPFWRNGIMADLCVLALEEGIEIEYAQRLIRTRSLRPAVPPVHLDHWPWPIRVYTLGCFSLVTNGVAISADGKAKKKPLELLKVLIACGGQRVNDAQLTDALWPEADGDAAQRALITTVQRLRTLLGCKEAVHHGEGRLSINPQLCWVDVWAFERMLGSGRPTVEATRRAVALYRGPFLADEPDASWGARLRQRLQREFAQAIERLAQREERRRQWDRAADWYERAIEADNTTEDFYRRLMVCYGKQGRRDEALGAYMRCRTMLASRFNTVPDRQTEAIRAAL